MKLAEFVKQKEWARVKAAIEVVSGSTRRTMAVEFVVFDWKKIKRREEDSGNIFNYFIGWDGEAGARVEKGDWIPFGAGGMSTTALKYDGGFQETGHMGMLFADVSESKTAPKVIYFNKNQRRVPPSVIADSLSALEDA